MKNIRDVTLKLSKTIKTDLISAKMIKIICRYKIKNV